MTMTGTDTFRFMMQMVSEGYTKQEAERALATLRRGQRNPRLADDALNKAAEKVINSNGLTLPPSAGASP